MLGRSWVEINTETIAGNYHICERLLRPGQEIMAVVKADAYGHGDSETAKLLQREGCRHFAVSNIEEAINVRKGGATGQILILGYTPVSRADDLLQYDITQTLLDESFAEAFADRGIKAQFAIDTGMNRIGLNASDPEYCEKIIRSYAKRFRLTGIFTHFAVADTASENAFTMQQTEKFREVADRVRDLKLPYIHTANSAAGLMHNEFGNLWRLGIVMYGLKPDISNVLPEGIRPALTWKSVISMIHTADEDTTVSYGRTFRTDRKLRIATIPTGYADGYNRMLSGRGVVLIHGKKAPILGRVCMDQMMVDVTEIPEARREDTVTLLGEGYTADDMAETIGTIGYEIICAISKRVPKVYLK